MKTVILFTTLFIIFSIANAQTLEESLPTNCPEIEGLVLYDLSQYNYDEVGCIYAFKDIAVSYNYKYLDFPCSTREVIATIQEKYNQAKLGFKERCRTFNDAISGSAEFTSRKTSIRMTENYCIFHLNSDDFADNDGSYVTGPHYIVGPALKRIKVHNCPND